MESALLCEWPLRGASISAFFERDGGCVWQGVSWGRNSIERIYFGKEKSKAQKGE